jgi:hypothetical protein
MPSILIVNAYYAPCARIGARRVEKMAGYLQKAGWAVTVLTLDEKYTPPLDYTIKPPDNIEIIRTNAFLPKVVLRNYMGDYSGKKEVDDSSLSKSQSSPIAKKSNYIVKAIRAIKKSIFKHLGRLNKLDEWGGWQYFAVRAVKGRNFDIVLGSYPPATSASIAQEISKRLGSKLVLDYRDPWFEVLAKNYPYSLDKHKQAEDLCLRDASLVIGVSPTICNLLKKRTDSNKVEFYPAGYTARIRGTVKKNKDNRKYFIYAGTLAYGRSLIPFLKGFQMLTRDYSPDEIGIIYCGPSSKNFNEEISQFKINDYSTDYGLLTKQAVDQLISTSVGVIVIASPGYEFQYQGKIFDTLELGVPLFLIGSPDSDASLLISKYSLGWSCEPENINGIYESLKNALLQDNFNYDKEVNEIEINNILNKMEVSFKALIID